MTGIRVVRGEPDDDELAAVLAVLAALGERPPGDAQPDADDAPFGRRPTGAPFVAAAAWVGGCPASRPRW